MKINSFQRRGFSLVELLVVVALLGLLATLVLAAVSSARQSSRTLLCANKIKTLACGVQLYADTWHVLPTSIDENPLGHWPRMLPFLDGAPSEPLVRQLRSFSSPGTDPFPSAAFVKQFDELFLCPEGLANSKPPDSFDGDVYLEADGTVGVAPSAGRNSYCGNTGLDTDFLLPRVGEGPFAKPLARWADFHQGLSKTALISEVVASYDGPRAGRRREHELLSMSTAAEWPVRRDFADACAAGRDLGPAGTPLGRTWWFDHNDTTYYCHAAPPGGWNCVGLWSAGRNYTAVAASSRHNSVVNVAMADGSVHAVGYGIDLEVWRRMGTLTGESF